MLSYIFLACAFICTLCFVSYVDLKRMEIPNGSVLTIFLLSVIRALLSPSTIADKGLGMLVAGGTLLALFVCTLGRGIGFGDVKLMLACGGFLGFKSALVALVLGFLLGGLWGCWLMVQRIWKKSRSRSSEFAFGPALCTGCVISLFLGTTIFNYYVGLW